MCDPILKLIIISFFSIEDNEDNETITFSCEITNCQALIDMLYLINATVVPFIGMFFLSIALITTVYRSRMNLCAITRRDNRFAKSTISINVMFFVFTFPLSLYYFFTYDNSIFSHFASIIYYANYGICFYMQLIVNRDFRDEFLRLVKLKAVRNDNTSDTRSNMATLSVIK